MKDRTQQYWLDSEIEAKKQFDVKSWEIEKHNRKYREILACANELLPNKNIETVLSLACGSCWLESELFENSNVKEFTGIDFSAERFDAANQNLKNLQLKLSKEHNLHLNYELIQGDVYELNIERKFDLIIMVQAFHHFDSPVYLLKNLHKLLNEGGHILIVGEHHYSFSQTIYRLFKHTIKYTINYKNYRGRAHWLPGYNVLFAPCLIKGDNHYSDHEYKIFAHRSSMCVRDNWKEKRSNTKGFLLAPDLFL